MPSQSSNNPESLAPAIRRARLDELSIFEISESELETLERGSPNALFLNLAISVLSVAISFSIALTTTITSTRVLIVFTIVAVISYIAGISFGLFWWRSHKSVKPVAQQIRSRLPPKGVRAPESANQEA